MNPAVIKAAQSVKKGYSNISPQSKKRARNIIIFIVLFLFFRRKITGAIRKMFHKDISKLEVDQSNLTYDRGEYFSMCSTLESAMDGSATQEDSIMEVMMRIKTQDDWNFLQKSFGVRKKDGGTFFSDLTGDLKMWLADDLDQGEMEEVRDTLRQHGVNY